MMFFAFFLLSAATLAESECPMYCVKPRKESQEGLPAGVNVTYKIGENHWNDLDGQHSSGYRCLCIYAKIIPAHCEEMENRTECEQLCIPRSSVHTCTFNKDDQPACIQSLTLNNTAELGKEWGTNQFPVYNYFESKSDCLKGCKPYVDV